MRDGERCDARPEGSGGVARRRSRLGFPRRPDGYAKALKQATRDRQSQIVSERCGSVLIKEAFDKFHPVHRGQRGARMDPPSGHRGAARRS